MDGSVRRVQQREVEGWGEDGAVDGGMNRKIVGEDVIEEEEEGDLREG